MSIPISAGKLIADTYGYDQVVIVARKVGVNGLENVTTYGVNKAHCDVAARMGDFFKHKLMNWPVPVESQAAEIAKLTALNSALTDKGNSYIIDNAKLTAERDAAKACADAAIERCAQVCEEIEASAWALWKLQADPTEQGRNIGAQHCADAIRALKGQLT